jgi:hypothetical protein
MDGIPAAYRLDARLPVTRLIASQAVQAACRLARVVGI